jgi:DNA-binding winged helix-turn-helix (wHTH) protein/Tfp pilus assembly protein PilF
LKRESYEKCLSGKIGTKVPSGRLQTQCKLANVINCIGERHDSQVMSVESQTPPVVRFGVFEADFRAGELRRIGRQIRIQDLPFRALKVLLEKPGEVISREDLRAALWPPDVFVDFDRAISSAIKRLRDALGDSADNPIFIETLERRGYRWIAPTTVICGTNAPIAPPLPSTAAATQPDIPVATEAEAEIALPARKVFPIRVTLSLLSLAIAVLAVWGIASAKLHPAHPANSQARDLYLEGRYYWSKRTPDDLHKAVDYFTQAIVHDPGYAEAYVGLADCYNLLREYAAMPASEAFPRARAAAAKAVELDPKSSQARASLAFAAFWGFWDADTSDREFRRAIELDPKNAIAHHWYATTLQELGRVSQALVEIERAQALDPTSRAVLADKAVILDELGRRKESADLLQQMEKSDPSFVSPHRYLKRLDLQNGDYRGYLAEQRQEAVLTDDASALQIASASEKGFAAGGAQGMFDAQSREQQKLFEEGKLDAYFLAETCALAGDKSAALKYLKLAFDQHSQEMPGIAFDPAFKSLRGEPAFRQLQAAMKLPYAETRPQ